MRRACFLIYRESLVLRPKCRGHVYRTGATRRLQPRP
jgi:hypothetical protein